MNWLKPWIRSPYRNWAIASLLCVMLLPQGAIAQHSLVSEWGPPRGNRTGGGQRGGNCPNVDVPLAALAPIQDRNGMGVVQGTTALDYPTLWFYMPYNINESLSASLWIEEPEPGSNLTSERIYYIQRQIMALPDTPAGLVSIRIPASEPPLTVGKTYRWLLVVQCDPTDASGNKVADIYLERVNSPTAAPPPETASVRDQLYFYMRARLWSEYMDRLGTLHCQAPRTSAIATEWNKTMQFLGMSALIEQPNLPCSSR